MNVSTPTIEVPDEVYISVDIEADGPIPGNFSMISLGATVVGRGEESYYETIRPISPDWVPEALAVSGFSRTETLSFAHAHPAMIRFADWLDEIAEKYSFLSGQNAAFNPFDELTRPRLVMVGFNAPFDWMFVHWYLINFAGRNPLGISALDIKAMYQGYAACRWSDTGMKQLPALLRPRDGLSHNALEDARDQAEIFQKLRLISHLQRADWLDYDMESGWHHDRGLSRDEHHRARALMVE